MPETKTNKSQIAIVNSAKTLFWKYGIRKVSVEEICMEAGISKMTFYRNFTNKNEVANKLLDQIVNASISEYRTIMNQDIPFSDKVHQLIQLKHRRSNGISQEFLNDVYMHYTHLKNRLEEYREQMLKDIIRDLKKAQKKGEIRKDIKPAFILYMLNLLNEKLLDEQLIAIYNNTSDLIMELTKFFFYGISPEAK